MMDSNTNPEPVPEHQDNDKTDPKMNPEPEDDCDSDKNSNKEKDVNEDDSSDEDDEEDDESGLDRWDYGERRDYQMLRRRLIKAMVAEKENREDGKPKHLWDPIFGTYLTRGCMYAANLFQPLPTSLRGEETMERLFALPPPMRRDHSHPYVLSPKNALLVNSSFADIWDQGIITIVPDLKDDASEEERLAWDRTEPKSYKIKVLDPEASDLNTEDEYLKSKYMPGGAIPGGKWKDMDNRPLVFLNDFRPSAKYMPGGAIPGGKWKDMDNRPLVFLNDFRPSAKYFFWHFCMQVYRYMQNVRRQEGTETARPRLKLNISPQIWGTRGQYISKPALVEFVKELGEEWAFLEEYGIDEELSPERYTFKNSGMVGLWTGHRAEDEWPYNEAMSMLAAIKLLYSKGSDEFEDSRSESSYLSMAEDRQWEDEDRVWPAIEDDWTFVEQWVLRDETGMIVDYLN